MNFKLETEDIVTVEVTKQQRWKQIILLDGYKGYLAWTYVP